jgi:hypothetical protein
MMIEEPKKPVVYTDEAWVRIHGTLNSVGSMIHTRLQWQRAVQDRGGTIVNPGGRWDSRWGTSKSESEDSPHDKKSTDCKKWLEEEEIFLICYLGPDRSQ